jgi:hypothetical protein
MSITCRVDGEAKTSPQTTPSANPAPTRPANAGCDDSPVRSASSRNTPTPAYDTTPRPAALIANLDRCATLHLESALPFGIVDPREVSLFLAGQALSLIQGRCHTNLHAKSRLDRGSLHAGRRCAAPWTAVSDRNASERHSFPAH